MADMDMLNEYIKSKEAEIRYLEKRITTLQKEIETLKNPNFDFLQVPIKAADIPSPFGTKLRKFLFRYLMQRNETVVNVVSTYVYIEEAINYKNHFIKNFESVNYENKWKIIDNLPVGVIYELLQKDIKISGMAELSEEKLWKYFNEHGIYKMED